MIDDTVCGYLDVKGGFHKSKKERDESNLKVEIESINKKNF